VAAPPAERPGQGRYLEILKLPDIRAAIVVTFVVMLGYGIIAPVLPLYARSFGVGYDSVGLLVAAFGLARLFFDPFAGNLVDRYGPRAMATTGSIIVGISSALAAIAPNFPLLVVFRGAGGAGSSIFFAAVLSYVLAVAPKDRVGQVMGVYFGAFNIGIILGQPVGGVIARLFGLASPLMVYAGSCFLSAWLFLRWMHDPVREAPDDAAPRGLRAIRWDRPFVTTLVVNAAYSWFIAAVISTLIPLFGHDRVGLSEIGIGAALAVELLAELVVLFPAGRAADRLGRKHVLVPSLLTLGASVAVLGLAGAPSWFFLAMVPLGIASGVAGVPPAVMLSDVMPARASGTAVGIFRFVGDLGFLSGPLVAGVVAARYGFGPAFVVSSIPCVIAVGMLLTIRDTLLPRPGDVG